MDFEIKNFQENDRDEIISMMETFYTSDAVSTNGSEEIFNNNFQNCIKNNPYLEGFVFVKNNLILGYSIIAKSFSTEFGKPCIWLEDLYIKPEYRGQHIIPTFIEYIENIYPNSLLRLEVEDYNKHAVHVYNKVGFEILPYMEMKKEI